MHTNIVLLDEINRSSAKTQSAMLEAMEERQTTIAGHVYPIPEPFLVIATQNPVDQEGTYPLSEAQTDRFLLKDVVSLPLPRRRGRGDRPDGRRAVRQGPPQQAGGRASTTSGGCSDIVRHVHMDRALMLYASELVAVTRDPGRVPAAAARPPDRIRRQPARDHRVLPNRARAGCAVAAATTSSPTTSPASHTACCGTG